MSTTPHLGLPLLAAAQAQKHVTHNESLFALDALVQCAVLDKDLPAPPADPAEGARYIVGPAATGDWTGQEDLLLLWQDGAWLAIPPRIGFIVYVVDEALFYVFLSGGWAPLTDALVAIQNLARLGIGTAADAANPFAAKLNKALWTARGTGEGGTGDLRCTLNKESAANVLSLLFQTNYSGRLELGLIGDDRLVAKVSPDGASWHEALSADPASGSLDFLSAEASLASAATVDLGAQPTRRIAVTGTTTITSFGNGANKERLLRLADALTLRHNATSLILPGAADIVTVAGDTAVFASDGAGNWRCLDYQRASGKALAAPGATEIAGTTPIGRALLTARSSGLVRSLLSVRQARANRLLSTYVASAPWTARTSAADNSWYGVCWSAELGLFCAVASSGTGNRVMTSPDGITWTARASSADNGWVSVCWSAELGLFCAVAASGASNRVMTSPDGITWTGRASAVANNWASVCWSAELGLFCAVASTGTGNRVITSPNGITWTPRDSAADNNWVSVCWSAELGLFCAVATTGTGNRVMTSPDGINWTIGTSGADNTWSSGCWSAELGQFCAVGLSGTGNRVMASSSAHLYWPAHPSVSASLSAAGTTQATARALTSAVSILTTVASGSGVVLALSDPGTRQEVLNRGANALLVYPPSGAQIEAAGTDTAVSLPAGGRAAFLCASATQFYQT